MMKKIAYLAADFLKNKRSRICDLKGWRFIPLRGGGVILADCLGIPWISNGACNVASHMA